MTLLKFILRSCRERMALTTLAALVSGACNAGLIALVNVALHRTGRPGLGLIAAFAGLGLGKVLSNFISQRLLASFSQAAIAGLRQDLIRRILSVPLRQLEEIGPARILVTLTDDVLNVAQALMAIPLVTVNAAILLGGAGYLGWLSWQLLLGSSVMIALGAFVYRILVASAFRCVAQAREEEDRLFGHFRALTEGIKELKLHRDRRGAFFSDNIQVSTRNYQRHNVAAETRFILAQSWSHLLYFALIGLILFLVPKLGSIDSYTLSGYLITTLYLMGPLAGVLGAFSLFSRANVALAKVDQLGLSLGQHSTELCSSASSNTVLRFQRLDLIDVVHSYHREQDDSHFVLGPIHLTFFPGELVFLVGGNGSGKSTLAKIITGLYLPESGIVRLDGKEVTDLNRDDYRQLFSAVFADFYLFDQLLGLDAVGLDTRAEQYLKQLHLHHKVRIRDGRLSSTGVSQGQRKRLALMTAYLEDRPFYLFDEWAADQDPEFKRLFYTRLLPDLKARGKTVLVITHDDQYFDVADRILKLDYGKLVAGDPPQLLPVASPTSLSLP